MSKQLKYSLIVFVKLLIVGFAFWAIYKKIVLSVSTPDFVQFITDYTTSAFMWFVLVLILLTGVNWILEAVKWNILISHLQKITFFHAFKAVVSGSTLGIFTPNRLGDMAGRVLFLQYEKRLRAIVCTSVGSFAQMVVISSIGVISALFFCSRFLVLEPRFFYGMLYVAVLLVLLLLFVYFNINWLAFITNKWIKNDRVRKVFSIMDSYTTRELAFVLLLSLARYLLYSGQYIALVIFLLPELQWAETMMLINLIFFVQTVVPSFAMADIGIRGATSLYFLGFVSTNTIAILTASVILWCINIMLPALVGAVFFIQQRFFDDGVRTV